MDALTHQLGVGVNLRDPDLPPDRNMSQKPEELWAYMPAVGLEMTAVGGTRFVGPLGPRHRSEGCRARSPCLPNSWSPKTDSTLLGA